MRRLEPSLLDAAALPGDWRVRAGRLARALAGALPDLSPHPLDAAVARLELGTADGITMLARSVALTPRTLQRRFQDQVGLDPTLLRRIFRFRTAFRLLERLPPGRWSQVAPRAGYFDQAHLIREFRRFAGSAPSAFFGAEPELARVFGGSEPAE
jgi:transcriptional regulator GlxA family with amidase domain